MVRYVPLTALLAVLVSLALSGCGNFSVDGYPATSAVETDIIGTWMSQNDVSPDAQLEFAEDGHFEASGFVGDLVCETNGTREKTGLFGGRGRWLMGLEDEREGRSTVTILWSPDDSAVGEPCERYLSVQQDGGELVLTIRDRFTENSVTFERESH